MGYRFRLHRRDLPGVPDLVFPGRKAVIFVHGCFWHFHDCPRGRREPRNNAEYWQKKRTANVARGKRAIEELERLGWRALVIWECQIPKKNEIVKTISNFLNHTLK
jgi:DNA mismatch endonuclease (patch repair protein)